MTVQRNIIDLEKMTVLVVDDMKSMRLTIRKMLKHLSLGKHLKFAQNGREGLQILHASYVDLVIMDWSMPIVNGTQMLESIRNDRSLRDMPVIMVSAESEKDIVLEVAETEIDGYLLKPLTLDALDTRVRAVVDKANNPDKSTILIAEAREFEEAGDIKTALRRIKLALALKPKASRLHRQLGLLYDKAGKPDKAEKCLKKAALINPQDAMTRKILGDMYIQKKDFQTASQYYLEAMSQTTRFSETAIQLGEKLLRINQKHIAISLFSKVISHSKKNLNDKKRIIEICLNHGELLYPRELLDSIIKEFPSKYDMVYQAGEVYAAIGDTEKALELFEIVDRYQTTRIDVKLEIARIHFGNDKMYKADQYLNKVLQKDPDNVEALALRRSI
ncbi:MAG: response regulator [Desulfobacula sp.]|nr:response regulator [Desulfobacula sp.]